MNASILATKCSFPILRQDRVPRPRLLERLNAGLWQEAGFVRKLTLVSAPAGFGKTTLISEWLDDFQFPLSNPNPESKKSQTGTLQPLSRHRAAWLSLDESDNDPARFLAYLIAALRMFQPEFGARTETLLLLAQPPPPEIILTSLVNELSSLPASFALALDDYHTIHTPLIHQQLAFILDHQPANMHLVILTREDPLLPVARLRARGQLLEIRQDDLRFTPAEIAEFFRRGSSLTINQEEISALESHTEGWAAGLQLAALSLRERTDLADLIHDLGASNRYILDYLMEEVFERQTVDVQNFLIQTSILKRLSGPLCDAVTGLTHSDDILRNLEQSNLFIAALDPARTWYRYHHLFGELLRHRLRLSGIAEAGLHLRASQWYEPQGYLQEAVEHALIAQDWGNAARLIGVVSDHLFRRGETATLLAWCGSLPQPIIHHSPELCLVNAWAALMTSQFDTAAPLLELAQQMAPPKSYLLGQVASAQAFLARAQRDNKRAIEKSEQALALLPSADIVIRGNIAMNLGLAYWHEGRMSEADTVLVQACDLCARSGNVFALLTAQIFLARIPAVRGQLHRASAMAENLIQAGGQVPILCLAYYDLSTIHLEWNDLPKALEHFEKGFAFSQRIGNVEFLQSGHLLRAILAHAQGDDDLALAALQEAETLSRDFPAAVRARTAALGVQLALAHSDPQQLAYWADKANANSNVDSHSFYRFFGLTPARLLIAKGEKDKALELLKKLAESASRAGWGYGLLVIRILQCLAAKTIDEAVTYLSDALQMARPEGFIRSFVDTGKSIIPILQEAALRGIEPEYAGRILTALGAENRKMSIETANLVEPLSGREIEVLRLVTAGLSNREIARKLVISPGTAKTHIHNLCGKMGVRNRTEAAVLARELGLV